MSRENLYLTATAARLAQGVQLARRITAEKPIGTTLIAIMGVDLADGILARRDGADGPKRRAMDSMVDSALIAVGLVSTYRKKPESRPYIGVLAAREAFVASGWAIDLAKTGQVKKGDDLHKLASVSIAGFCLAVSSGNETALKTTGLLAAGINTALAYDYYKGWTQPERNTMLDTGVMEVVGFYEARQAVGSLRYSGPPQLTAGDNRGIVLELALPATTEQLPSTSL